MTKLTGRTLCTTAAAVCGIDANVLASQKKAGDTTCTAQNGSRALAQQVVKQKLGGQRR